MKKTLTIYLTIIAISIFISFFNGISVVTFINSLFLVSIPFFTYAIFRRMYEIGMFKYFAYSIYAVSRFISSFGFAQKNSYADRVEKENLSKSNTSKIKSSDIKEVRTLESFMLEKIEKNAYTIPCIYASILSFTTSYILVFFFYTI